jgi:peptidyl-prolyl cis-trans isomerase SurA
MTLDSRAEARNEAQADELASQLLARCAKGERFEDLMRQYSEDPGSAATGMVYTVTETSRFVEPFKDLALHLKPQECGLVRSQYGWHVIKRLK